MHHVFRLPPEPIPPTINWALCPHCKDYQLFITHSLHVLIQSSLILGSVLWFDFQIWFENDGFIFMASNEAVKMMMKYFCFGFVYLFIKIFTLSSLSISTLWRPILKFHLHVFLFLHFKGYQIFPDAAEFNFSCFLWKSFCLVLDNLTPGYKSSFSLRSAKGLCFRCTWWRGNNISAEEASDRFSLLSLCDHPI